MKIAVLGGLGQMAEAALYDLTRQPGVTEAVAADRSLERRELVLSKLERPRKVSVAQVDLRDTAAAAQALKGTDILINAAWYELNLKAMDLALALGAHYLDLGGLFHMTLKQLKRSNEFRAKGLLGVLGCGSTPGLTNMMVARLADRFDLIDSAGVYDAAYDPSLSEADFVAPFSIRTMLDEHRLPAPIFKEGRLTDIAAHGEPEIMEFRRPIGRCQVEAVIHSELATLPAYLKPKKLREFCFKLMYPEVVKSFLAAWKDGQPLPEPPVASPGKPEDFEIVRVRMEGRAGGKVKSLELDCEFSPVGMISAGAMGVGFTAAITAELIGKKATVAPAGVFAPESCLDQAAFFAAVEKRPSFTFVERTLVKS